MLGLRSLTLSADPCRERRKLVKPKTARSRRSLFVEVSQERGGANVLFPFSSSSPPALLPSVPFPRSPSFAILCRRSSPTNARVCASTYPFRPFHWNGEGVRLFRRPTLRPFRIIRSPFFSSHGVLSRAVSFCLSPLLPVAVILSTRLLLPLVIAVDMFCLRHHL